MTTCTPIYGLTYAIGADAPCDIGDTLCQFADDVEVQLDALDAIVDRVIDSVPMAKVRMTVPLSVVIPIGTNYSTSIPFDTIDVDTADMVDLVANPYLMTLPRPGVYLTTFTLRLSSLVAGDNMGAVVTTSICSDEQLGDGSAVFMNGAFNLFYDPVNTGRDILSPSLTLDIFASVSAQTLNFTAASMSAIWVRDLP
jgi:hypothetical protein